jgi:hypothetical protein
MTELDADLSEDDARACLATVMADLRTLEDKPIEPKAAEPKSSLSVDDQEFRLMATSHLAQAGIGTAREHLLAMAYVWHSHEGGTLMPQAYATLARAALIGASNVVWLLTPLDRDERVRRTLLLASANFRNAATAQQETLASAPTIGITDVDVLTRQRAIVEGARANVQEVEAEWWRRFPRPAVGKAAKMEQFEQTKVIELAHSEVTKDEPTMGPYGKMVWRLMSGDAHAFVWQKLHRASMTGELAAAIAGPGDTFTFNDTHTAKSLLPFVLMPAIVFRHANKLWGFRAAPPPCQGSSPSSPPVGAR